MADPIALDTLKQGVGKWNQMRDTAEELGEDWEFDLSGTDLRGAWLCGANLSDVNLSEADLRKADLSFANLRGATLHKAKLTGADLTKAYMKKAIFYKANLANTILEQADLTEAFCQRVNLKKAKLISANLSGAYLTYANLSHAYLNEVNFRDTDLTYAKFDLATIGYSSFIDVDLSGATGLDTTRHDFPSEISVSTLTRSRGGIPDDFLKGCGLQDADIEYAKLYNWSLSNIEVNEITQKIKDLRGNQPIQISPLFISYSHANTPFVDKLEYQLNIKGVRYWRDIHDLKAGKIEKQIDRAIRKNPTVLLVLSKHSLKSDWVEHEVRAARGLEKELKRDVLCPVALDDSWKHSKWPERIMEQIMEYNILDFSEWKDDSKFDGMFRKLIDGLELFYKG